jgi:exodeoxyribonuclease VII small subunit
MDAFAVSFMPRKYSTVWKVMYNMKKPQATPLPIFLFCGITQGMKNFEERLGRLEELGALVKRNDIPLDEALAAFEEGIKLSRSLEKDLEKVENRIEILTNGTEEGASSGEAGTFPGGSEPALELFSFDRA